MMMMIMGGSIISKFSNIPRTCNIGNLQPIEFMDANNSHLG
jgi:hypothetical protein